MRCDENPEIDLNDKAIRVFLNTKGTNDSDVPKELIDFLHYVDSGMLPEGSNCSSKVEAIDTYVQKIKMNHEMGVKYMDRMYEERMMREEAQEEGWETGHSEGKAEGLAEGLVAGMAEGLASNVTIIRKKVQKHMSSSEIADLLEIEIDFIEKILEILKNHPEYNDVSIAREYLNL